MEKLGEEDGVAGGVKGHTEVKQNDADDESRVSREEVIRTSELSQSFWDYRQKKGGLR